MVDEEELVVGTTGVEEVVGMVVVDSEETTSAMEEEGELAIAVVSSRVVADATLVLTAEVVPTEVVTSVCTRVNLALVEASWRCHSLRSPSVPIAVAQARVHAKETQRTRSSGRLMSFESGEGKKENRRGGGGRRPRADGSVCAGWESTSV